MRIAFVIARVGEENNVIQRLSLALADELRKRGETITVFPFKRSKVFSLFSYRKFKSYDLVLIANVGLQSAYYSFFKRLGLIRKPFVAISFGSDIRATNHRLINFFNFLSKSTINLLIVISPDLVNIAEKRGYKNVYYTPNWAGALT